MTTAPGSADGIVYRLARPQDAGAVEALDGSFTTATVFEVAAADSGFGFVLREVPVDPPVHKAFPPEEHDEQGFAGGRGGGGAAPWTRPPTRAPTWRSTALTCAASPPSATPRGTGG
ncbi:hypothetical protein [Streptomyces sp. NPDC046685]|uniref:hypothetical protein n=1 Tax=Streptomyces sp. NPDC046685 TaxID=3157202 RepID=UPI0033C14BC8